MQAGISFGTVLRDFEGGWLYLVVGMMSESNVWVLAAEPDWRPRVLWLPIEAIRPGGLYEVIE